MVEIVNIPRGSVIARYAETPRGWAVVTPSGKTLAPSFFDLRHRFIFGQSINGLGGWVVLLPIPQPTQTALF